MFIGETNNKYIMRQAEVPCFETMRLMMLLGLPKFSANTTCLCWIGPAGFDQRQDSDFDGDICAP